MDNQPDGSPTIQGPACPLPLPHQERIVVGHGSGGKMSHDLIRRVFLPAFDNPVLSAGDDAGLVALDSFKYGYAQFPAESLVVSTDSHVVWPLFFAGGDIGRLAVCGTVNDLAMLGAQPLCLSAGFILEEGLEISLLVQVVTSMRMAALEAGVPIVAGDTKVVQKGKADGLYINTTGVGLAPPGVHISGNNARPGDAILLSGPIGDHGIAVLEARGELGFKSGLVSDVAPLNALVHTMLSVCPEIHSMRDPTRGGLAASLNEIAAQSGVCIRIEETRLPVRAPVQAACEMLGLDPLHIANEGKLIAIVPQAQASSLLAAMRVAPGGADSVNIGEVLAAPPGRVLLHTALGTTRIIDMPSGEILPRIC